MSNSASIPPTGGGDTASRSGRGGTGQSAGGGGSRFEAMLRGQFADHTQSAQESTARRPEGPRGPADASSRPMQGAKDTSGGGDAGAAPGVPAAPASPSPTGGEAVHAGTADGGAVPVTAMAPPAGEAALPLDLDGLFLDPELAAGVEDITGEVPSPGPVAALPAAPSASIAVAAATPLAAEQGASVALASSAPPPPVAGTPPAVAVAASGTIGEAPPAAAAPAAAVPGRDARDRGAPVPQAAARGAGLTGTADAGDTTGPAGPAPAFAAQDAAAADGDFRQALDTLARGGERGANEAAGPPARGPVPGTGFSLTPPAGATETSVAAPPRHALVLDHALGTAGWDAALGARMAWSVSNGVQAASLDLNPRDLGPVNVQLSVHEDEVTLTFVSQHAAVREAIEAALPRLRELLADGGFDLGGVEISADADQAGPGGETADGHAQGHAPGGDGQDGDAPAAAPVGVRLAEGLVDTFA